MKKIILALALLPLMCYADFNASFFTSNQKLIMMAVEQGFAVVEQTYQLEDTVTHQRFGRYGDAFFGKSRVLGVRIGDGILAPASIMTPWAADPNFERYSTTHRPVPFSTSLYALNDSTLTGTKVSDAEIQILPDSSVVITEADKKPLGFEVGGFENTTEGWLVWVVSEKTIDEWNGEPTELIIYRKKIDFAQDKEKYEIESPKTESQVWGGIYIVPTQTQVGQITFHLAGPVVKNADGQWMLDPLVSKEDIENKREELTPF